MKSSVAQRLVLTCRASNTQLLALSMSISWIVISILVPGSVWMYHSHTVSHGYALGYPGLVKLPRDLVSSPPQPVEGHNED